MRVASLIAALIFADTAMAAAPILSYAGRLVDASGQELSGPVDIKLRLYSGESEVSPLFTQSFAATTLNQGYFSLNLSVADSPSSLTIMDALRGHILVWVEVELNGGVLPPRQRITPVPWSSNVAGIDSTWAAFTSIPPSLQQLPQLSCAAGDAVSFSGSGVLSCHADAQGVVSTPWSSVSAIPAQLTNLAALSCSEGEQATAQAGSWSCSVDDPSGLIPWSAVQGEPTVLDQIEGLSCAEGETLRRSGGTWICGGDGMGPVVDSLSTGSYLSSSGTSVVNVGVDFSKIVRANGATSVTSTTTAAAASPELAAIISASNDSASGAGTHKVALVGAAENNGRTKVGVLGWADGAGTNIAAYGIANGAPSERNFGATGRATNGAVAIGISGEALQSQAGTATLYGVYGEAPGGKAGYFAGDVNVVGDLLVGATPPPASMPTQMVFILARMWQPALLDGTANWLWIDWQMIFANPTISTFPRQAVAPIELPNGSTITELSCPIYDGGASSNYVQVDLNRQSKTSEGTQTTLATVGTTGPETTGSIVTKTTTTIANPTVDLQTYKYSVTATVTLGSTATPSLSYYQAIGVCSIKVAK